ncbi:hypothetical protein GCM10022204_32320 [Microlunatus aurantiacus]|uniref:Uncharacterized protein n=1 Tax=Microlunatus aurantiacus TaxID=446786 RepID=A0ABP7DZ06_9ACTN
MITFALSLVLLTVVFPVAVFYAGAWLISSAYDETSALRRMTVRLGVTAE